MNNKYQDALEKMFYYNMMPNDITEEELKQCDKTLQELVDIYPEYLELKTRATPTRVKYVYKDIEFGDKYNPLQMNATWFIGGKIDKSQVLVPSCPNCNKIFTEQVKYCPNCCKAIGWNEDELKESEETK